MKTEKNIAITYLIAFAVAGAISLVNCLFFLKTTITMTVLHVCIGGFFAATCYLGFVWVESREHIWLSRMGLLGIVIMAEALWMLKIEMGQNESETMIKFVRILMIMILYFVATNHGEALKEEKCAPIHIIELPFDDPFVDIVENSFEDQFEDPQKKHGIGEFDRFDRKDDEPPEGPENSD